MIIKNREKREKTFKQMLYFALVSLTMSFAGLTSAYIISSGRKDWVTFNLPTIFYISTLVIILSSISFYFAKKSMQKENKKRTSILLFTSLVLGILFVYCQYSGYLDLTEAGLYFTGKDSNVASSLFDIVAFAHAVHVLIGLVVILVLLFNNYREKYTAIDYLGIKLGEIFWHFLGGLWVFLFLFFIAVL